MFAVPREQVVRVHASSGTTGKPTVVGYTQGDIDRWADLVARSIRAAGGRRGDMVHVAYGYGLFTGGLGAHYGAEKLGCTVVPVSGGQTEKQVQLIEDFRPDIIMVTPSYMQVIVEEFRRRIRRRCRCRWASSAPNPGRRRCAATSSAPPASRRWTSTGCPR
jgi:phenylacetate-CoA ligase